MRKSLWLIAILVVAAVAYGIYWMTSALPDPAAELGSGTPAAVATADPGRAGAGDTGSGTPAPPDPATPAMTAAPADPTAASGSASAPAAPGLDLERRRALLAVIARARAARTGGGGAGDEEGDVGHLDKDYIKERIGEIKPLLRECYELAREGEDEALAGGLTVEFVMAGEPEIGGIIEASNIIDADDAIPETSMLRECVRETMHALEFEPPAGGGKVTVRYPFKFSTVPDVKKR